MSGLGYLQFSPGMGLHFAGLHEGKNQILSLVSACHQMASTTWHSDDFPASKRMPYPSHPHNVLEKLLSSQAGHHPWCDCQSAKLFGMCLVLSTGNIPWGVLLKYIAGVRLWSRHLEQSPPPSVSSMACPPGTHGSPWLLPASPLTIAALFPYSFFHLSSIYCSFPECGKQLLGSDHFGAGTCGFVSRVG